MLQLPNINLFNTMEILAVNSDSIAYKKQTKKGPPSAIHLTLILQYMQLINLYCYSLMLK